MTLQKALLGEVCGIRSGATPRRRLDAATTGGTLTVQQGDIDASGNFAADTAMRVDATAASPRHHVGSDELVFRSRGPFWSASVLPELGEPISAISPLFILRPASDILDAGYLAWFVGRPLARRYFAAEAQGSGVQMVTKTVLAALPLDLPEIRVQRMIAAAAALSAAENRLTTRAAGLRRDLFEHRLDRLASEPTGTSTTRETR